MLAWTLDCADERGVRSRSCFCKATMYSTTESLLQPYGSQILFPTLKSMIPRLIVRYHGTVISFCCVCHAGSVRWRVRRLTGGL